MECFVVRKLFTKIAGITLGCVMLFAGGVSSAERLTLYGGMTLYANPDYDSVSLAEFTFSINRHELEFYQPLTDDSLYYARIFAQIDLYGTRGTVIDSAATLFSVRVKDLEEASQADIRIFNKVSLYIPAGMYSAKLTVIDAASKTNAEVFYNSFTVLPPVVGRMALSEICLAYDITKVSDTAAVDRRLVRNGFKIIPNPIATYSPDDQWIHLYAEAYNLSYESSKSHHLKLSLAALKADSTIYRLLGTKSAQNTGNSAVVTDSFDISGWPTGIYLGRLIALDEGTGGTDTAFAPFQIVSAIELAQARKEKRNFDPYDTLSLQSREHLVKYLLTPAESQALSGLGDRAKMNYLDEFWKQHDDYPETPEIENRLDLMERFEDANRLYSTNYEKTNGWYSHIGRVLLKYGRPSRIEDKTAEWVNSLPMQVWYYWEMDEGAYFLFADKRFDFDFWLVHSNVEGEIYDPDWQEVMDAGWFDDIGFNPVIGE